MSETEKKKEWIMLNICLCCIKSWIQFCLRWALVSDIRSGILNVPLVLERWQWVKNQEWFTSVMFYHLTVTSSGKKKWVNPFTPILQPIYVWIWLDLHLSYYYQQTQSILTYKSLNVWIMFSVWTGTIHIVGCKYVKKYVNPSANGTNQKS